MLFLGGVFMFTRTVNISSLSDAKKFVDITSKYDDVRMRLRIGDYEINAHSIVGVLSVTDSNKNPVFTADLPDNDETLLKEIEPFLVAENE